MGPRQPPANAGYTTAEVLAWLEARASAENCAGMARFGINTDKAFGVSNAVLRPFAKTLGRNLTRALELWDSGWREARLLALFTDDPDCLDLARAHAMAHDFNSWEIVDQASDLFVEAGHLDVLAPEFAADEREFVRRTAFSMIALAAVHLKKRNDAEFLVFLPLIERHATDPRNFVRKAVNWALRQIGKRSIVLHGPAFECARTLTTSDDKAARWIGKDALRELSSDKVQTRLKNKPRPA